MLELDFDSATVLAEDDRVRETGGVPRGAFQLAAARTREAGELLLLRVQGCAGSPDPAERSRTAFTCDVLGTFWDDPATGGLLFGPDVEDVTSPAVHQVFRPSPASLERLASFPVTAQDPDVFDVGTVRFSAGPRGLHAVPVRARVSDLLAGGTAVLGTSPAGRSRVVRTLTAAVHRHGQQTGDRVGQLVLDPQGRYAEAHDRDGATLSQLGGPDQVWVYRMHADTSDDQVRALGMNFFDLAKTEQVVEIVNDTLSRDLGAHSYVKDLTSIDWAEPKTTDVSAWTAWSRARVGLYGLLALCGFRSDSFYDPAALTPGLWFVWSAASSTSSSASTPAS